MRLEYLSNRGEGEWEKHSSCSDQVMAGEDEGN